MNSVVRMFDAVLNDRILGVRIQGNVLQLKKDWGIVKLSCTTKRLTYSVRALTLGVEVRYAPTLTRNV